MAQVRISNLDEQLRMANDEHAMLMSEKEEAIRQGRREQGAREVVQAELAEARTGLEEVRTAQVRTSGLSHWCLFPSQDSCLHWQKGVVDSRSMRLIGRQD